ncbi:GFA family protein [Streptomyces lonegramiae]
MTEPTATRDQRTGRCLCGDITYEVTGAPDDPHLCSCEHCTLLSGSPAMAWVGFRREELTWTGHGGEPTWYSTWLLRTTGASHGQVTGRSVLRGMGRYEAGELL